MKRLATTICLTIAVLFGSAVVSEGADFLKGLSAAENGDYATVNFQALKGPQIRRILEEIDEITFPDDKTGPFGSGPWDLTIHSNGSWEGHYLGGHEGEAFGSWVVKGDKFCISVKGSFGNQGSAPLEGCFSVYANPQNSAVAVRSVSLGTGYFELGRANLGAISEEIEKNQAKQPPLPVVASKPTAETLKHRLEMQRLALDRQRLEAETKLQQMKLELEMARLRQQGAGGTSPKTAQPPAPLIPDIAYGNYYALVIGINDYKVLPKLNTAVKDAKTVAKLLQDLYGFKVTLLINASRANIIDALDEYRDLLAEEDNLLIYYAGHGWLDPQTQAGYWLPKNAKPDRRSRWVSNATLTTALQGLLAKHVMVVADSCYSGTLTRSVKVPQRNRAYLERISEKRARVVLSSGGLEPVADSGGGQHSVFAAQFLKALQGNKGVLDGTQLFEKVRESVVLNADQTPEYSDIRRAGHEGGDFLFVRKY